MKVSSSVLEPLLTKRDKHINASDTMAAVPFSLLQIKEAAMCLFLLAFVLLVATSLSTILRNLNIFKYTPQSPSIANGLIVN